MFTLCSILTDFYSYWTTTTGKTKINDSMYYQGQNNDIFYCVEGEFHYCTLLKDVNNNTFQVIHLHYAIDKNSVYYNGKKYEQADPDTFIILDTWGNYTKDKERVYFEGQEISGADSATFNANDQLYAEDKYNKYKLGKIIK